MQRCIDLHHSKPWIENFERVLIAPARENVDQKPVGSRLTVRYSLYDPYNPGALFNPAQSAAIGEQQGLQFYEPSAYFWTTHCRVSHGCDQKDHCSNGGCITDVHADFLAWDSRDPEGPEFYYGYQLSGDPNTVYLEGIHDFERECQWFHSHLIGQ